MNLHDLETLKRLVVDPTVSTIRAELKPLVAKVQEHEERIDQLEKNQRKAVMAYGIIVAVFAAVGSTAFEFVKRKFGL